jgi:hypothetical protein
MARPKIVWINDFPAIAQLGEFLFTDFNLFATFFAWINFVISHYMSRSLPGRGREHSN